MLRLVATIALSLAGGEDDGLLPRSRFFAPVDRFQVQLAPDGSQVGYLHPDRTLVLLGLGDRAGDTRTVPPTPGPILSWSWTTRPDELLLVRVTPEGEHAYVHRLGTGEEQDLTPFSGVRSRIVATSARVPGKVGLVLGESTEVAPAYYRASLDGENALELLANDLGFTSWYTDGELNPVAARRPAPEGGSRLDRLVTGEWQELVTYDWEETRMAGALGASADGRRLFVVDPLGSDRSNLKSYDLATGEATTLYEHPLADLAPGESTLHPKTGEVEAVATYYPRMRRHLLDEDLAVDFEVLASVQPGDVGYAGRSLDGSVWLVRFLDGGPATYYAYDRTTRRATRLFRDVSALDGVDLARRHGFVIAASDGLPLPCDVYLPRGADIDGDGLPEKPLPTVFYVHGGPWIGFEWNSWFTNRNFQLLANRGYAVVRTDFRSAAGYGRAFLGAGDRQWGGRVREDVMDEVDWAIKQGISDPEHMALWGWAFGGYMTNMALTSTPERFACGMSMYGLSDLESFTRELHESGRGTDWFKRVGSALTEEGRTELRNQSPLFRASGLFRPLLLTHGGADALCPIDQSDRFAASLVEQKKPVTYLVYPEEPHDYRSPGSWISFWAVGERFLNEHLGGSYQPFGEDLDLEAFEVRAGADLVPGLEKALRRSAGD